MQPDFGTPALHYSEERKEMSPSSIDATRLRDTLEGGERQIYEEKRRDGEEYAGPDNENYIDAENDEDDSRAKTPVPVRNPKRRREPKKIPDSDEPPKKRKRNIMNEHQIRTIEHALKTEPEMQRYPKLILKWTNDLNEIGPEIAAHQLKNWLNNRKARLARIAREEKGPEVDVRGEHSRQTRSAPGPAGDQSHGTPGTPPVSPERNTTGEGSQGDATEEKPSTKASLYSSKVLPEDGGSSPDPLAVVGLGHNVLADSESSKGGSSSSGAAPPKFSVGQYVCLRDVEGKEVGLGCISQVEGTWQGRKLEEQNLCAVVVTDLRVDRKSKLPYPSSTTGTSFDESETLQGKIKVAWNKDKLSAADEAKST